MFIKLTDKHNAPIYVNALTIISMTEEKKLMDCDVKRVGFDIEISINGYYDATRLVCGVNGLKEIYFVKETPDELRKLKGE